MEVIDFNDLMKEEKFVAISPKDKEMSEANNKSFIRNFVMILALLVIAVPVYFYIRFGGGASDEGALKYRGVIAEVISGMQSQYPNLKSVMCTERNPNRNDCIEFTLVFYPQDDPETVGTVMSPVDKAYGVSETDFVSLKATLKQMLEFKHQYIYGRRAPLSILILSSNMSRGGVIEETKMKCIENDKDMVCESVR
jgi:hypothetical protein